MNNLNVSDDGSALLEGEAGATLRELVAELNDSLADGVWFIEQNARDYETRNCVWPGQNEDGRKHTSDLGRDAFPWDEASDVRIRLADMVVNDNTRVLRMAMKRGLLQATPAESSDGAKATAVTTFLKVLLGKKMAQNLRREIPLLANWQEAYGMSVMAVTFDREERMKRRPISIEMLMETNEAAGEVAPERAVEGRMMLGAIFDAARTDEVAAWLSGIFPDLKMGMARRAVEKLRRTGECYIPVSEVVKSQPVWTALRVFRDVFFPTNTTELDSARWIAWREPLSVVDLRSRELADGYDGEAVEEAIEKCLSNSVVSELAFSREFAAGAIVDDMDGLIEVFHMFRRVVDEDGYTEIEVVHFCPGLEREFLRETLDYEHGMYPFIDFVRDRTERTLLTNRSVPALIETHQREVKNQRDYRVDRTSIAINPPLEVPMSRMDKPIRLGPGMKVPYRKPGEIKWMEPPPFDGDSINIEQQTRGDIDEYFGRFSDKVNPTRQTLYAQTATEDWLGGMMRAVDMTLALVDQYDREMYGRVTGMALEEGDSIRSEVDVIFEFNAADLNMEHVMKKAEVFGKYIAPLDTEGVLGRAPLAGYLARTMDPQLAGVVVQDVEGANKREADDEQLNFTKIISGTEPAMMEKGQNFALRLRVLQGIMEANGEDIGRDLAQKPKSQEMLQRRMEHLQFQVEQSKNAEIGRIGAMPALQ